jgi:hypothetical protein
MSWDLKIKILLFGIVALAIISVVTSSTGSLSDLKSPGTVAFYIAVAALGGYVLFLLADR